MFVSTIFKQTERRNTQIIKINFVKLLFNGELIMREEK